MFRPRPSFQVHQERKAGTQYQAEWVYAKERKSRGQMETNGGERERNQTKDWFSSTASWQCWMVQSSTD